MTDEDFKKIDASFQTANLSKRNKDLLTSLKKTLQPTESGVDEEGNPTAIFYGVQFATNNKLKSRIGLGLTYGFLMFLVFAVPLSLSSYPVETFLTATIQVLEISMPIFCLGFLFGFAIYRPEFINQNSDFGLRDANDFMETYVRHGNFLPRSYGFYDSEAYHDKVSGRVTVSEREVGGMVSILWQVVESYSIKDAIVSINKAFFLPWIADLLGLKTVTLVFKTPEDAAKFADLAKQYATYAKNS